MMLLVSPVMHTGQLEACEELPQNDVLEERAAVLVPKRFPAPEAGHVRAGDEGHVIAWRSAVTAPSRATRSRGSCCRNCSIFGSFARASSSSLSLPFA